MEGREVATAFVRRDGEVLATRRAADAPTHADRWDAISGPVAADETPIETARRAVREAVGLANLEHVRTGSSLTVDDPDEGGTRAVTPVLFEVGRADPDADPAPDLASAANEDLSAAESDDLTTVESDDVADAEWVAPTEFLRRETVPELWSAYRRVAPTVQSVAADDEHGAATLSIRALAVLRDRAGLLAAEGESDREELDALGRRLREARPSMAVLRNRVNRVLAESGPEPADVERAAIEGIAGALAADAEAARRAASLLAGDRVLTLSRSSTVLDALAADEVAAVSVAESRPACEGTDVAEALAARIDAPVTVHTDAAVAHVLATEPIDAVLVGADAVLPDGRVVNKTGTRAAALAAAREGVPVYVAAAADKVTTREAVNLESGDAAAVYDGDAELDVLNPTFDVTPADAVAGIVTERGVLDAGEVAGVAAELRELVQS